ncbi:DUF4268 domain-containing protein [Alkalibacterium sp. 20]|uniref:DUF4268 domain-containing protein n=1 Tax=Alkalibacterium sp. 20 TaxID=1798803 RepID=UPI0009004EA4|nr:DUF4268 domain-containing protein [Alkalibacterium sp. 20]
MSELESFSDLFQNKLFRIPDYQRGYAWKQNQLIDFWDDVMHLQEDRYHYTGLLSLKEIPKSETRHWTDDQWLIHNRGYKAYHVVDGQQRLTTFSILMNEILSFIKQLEENEEKSEDEIVINYETLASIRSKYISQKRPPHNIVTTFLFGYEIDNPSAEYLIHEVFDEPHSGTLVETYYTNNLKFAKTFFSDCLANLYVLEGIDGIENLYQKLTFQLMFNIHEIEKDYDVFVAFETMNNRGKKLSNLELLKNRLIYLTTLYDNNQLDGTDKDELRKQVNNAWKEVYYQLGRNQNTPLADDDFLRAHWSIYFQYTRNTGTDYIDFLLNKFSALNIYDKRIVLLEEETTEPITDDLIIEDDTEENYEETPSINVSKLSPLEIRSYVNSLKDVSQYWFLTHFPEQSDLSSEEKIWLERLNRIGIGYFRPIVALSLLPELNIKEDERVSLFSAVERFIFICFRMGALQSNYRSSYYYRAGRSLYNGEINVHDIIRSLNQTVSENLNDVLKNFSAKMDTRFSKHDGFYSWKDLRYVLYEYEYKKGEQTGIQKVGWKPFTVVEKDRVSIEHILPQTPTKWYWRNQFRKYSDNEIKLLSGSLGNLLPLSQSVNSSMQNDSFPDKKSPQTIGRRGYRDGSHSEIKVSNENEWNADTILERGITLLKFMEKRWDFSFENKNQMLDFLHIDFVKDDREDVPEIPEEISLPLDDKDIAEMTTSEFQLDFWTRFTKYCAELGRDADIATQSPQPQNWYDVKIGNRNYHIFFTVTSRDKLRVGIYIYTEETFSLLERYKDQIEKTAGFELEWYISEDTSVAKRVLHSTTTDLYDRNNHHQNFNWLITHFDKLKIALDTVEPI